MQTNRVRANDYAIIGGVLMAVLTPALFWHRAPTVDRTYISCLVLFRHSPVDA